MSTEQHNFEGFFHQATGHAPYAFQTEFATAPECPRVLRAPTGSGKTATLVLGWIWQRQTRAEATPRRLVICLPMRSLVKQTREAATAWIDRLGLGDEISVHILMGGDIDEDWEAIPERDCVLIGTQDQLLSRALMRGYGMSRYRWPVHFAWLNNDARWVFDEIQLMGSGLSTAAQLAAFRDTAEVIGPCESIFVSATLDERLLATADEPALTPALTVEPMMEPRLARLAQADKRLERADLDPMSPCYSESLSKLIMEKHTPGTRTLVVLNRVKRAQELYEALSKLKGRPAPGLLHSRFRPAERSAIEQRCLAPDWTGVLVATQAIEAGVDVSSKLMVTELAPWSSMVQRFGRCNRSAEHERALVLWIDAPAPSATDPKGKKAGDWALPYSLEALAHARALCAAHTQVGPAALDPGLPERCRPTSPVIRHKDLVELFDTTPDLDGYDTDVSRYIRDSDDADVQVAWRSLEKVKGAVQAPAQDAASLFRDELCRVPVYAMKKLAEKAGAWRWEGRSRRSRKGEWVLVKHFVPGERYLLNTDQGGYNPTQGWTGDKKHRPDPIAPPPGARGNEADAGDPLTHLERYYPLSQHSSDAAQEMRALSQQLQSVCPDAEVLVRAALWHDLGKIHPTFQEMLLSPLGEDDPIRDGGPWAKSDRRKGGERVKRKYFRHELASALRWLEINPEAHLQAYVIAAHHGKVRMGLRPRPGEKGTDDRAICLGVMEGDLLPAADLGEEQVPEGPLHLEDRMKLGGGEFGQSWRAMTEALLRDHGPFRLAYLEALVRVADWRASAKARDGGAQ